MPPLPPDLRRHPRAVSHCVIGCHGIARQTRVVMLSHSSPPQNRRSPPSSLSPTQEPKLAAFALSYSRHEARTASAHPGSSIKTDGERGTRGERGVRGDGNEGENPPMAGNEVGDGEQ
ncbi:hypothetical protein PIB30_042562 [Stylosanthes scabra]|uniref:Uncharacterized protein n=1 Tax=Stylosanthes scabra TaxID=79078 RepID=A0ABU6YE24_9FABA|nr:hypothetical protein [Stylosanthes scabra]